MSRLFSPTLEGLIGPARRPDEPLSQRHKDIASSVQAIYEERLFDLLSSLQDRHPSRRLVLSGGCAMNSVANGKIHTRSGFNEIWIPPASGDAGGAIGAALVAWQSVSRQPRSFVMDHAYWGPGFTDNEIGDLLMASRADLDAAGCQFTEVADEEHLLDLTARLIAEGNVVGWFQGRMEWGPRALGNRSILCDPRRANMRDILNVKIKRRESFRPFAPSILREAVPEWFESDADVPFMMRVFQIRESKRALIPAVTHVDNSGRLHTVTRDANPLFYRLIKKFSERCGVPLLLNTSFNENEPVVCRPEEALDCFLRTGMDLLVLGRYVLSRGIMLPPAK